MEHKLVHKLYCRALLYIFWILLANKSNSARKQLTLWQKKKIEKKSNTVKFYGMWGHRDIYIYIYRLLDYEKGISSVQ